MNILQLNIKFWKRKRVSLMALLTTVLTLSVCTLTSCTDDDLYLHYALKAAGDNKSELKAVLKHYRTEDKDPEKLKAAKYLIANMPAHYSYADTAMVNRYYAVALQILKSGKDAEWQRDTLRVISERDFPGMSQNVVSDVQVMTSDYLIYSIDHAFAQWRTRPWAKHLTYEEFRDWLLPYKVTELQSFDAWRDTLSAHFSDSISNLPVGDDRCRTIYGALDIVRNEMVGKLNPYITWTTAAGHPLLSAETMAYTTYGSCLDYVTLGTAVFCSLGLPAVIDNVPLWGRNHEGHTWYTLLSDNGIQMPSQNDITIPAGWGFYPYQRFPKIYRQSYGIDRDILKYWNKAKYIYPFDLCKEDITSDYYRTSDVQVNVWDNVKLKDKYVYIATLTNSGGPQWFILDYGTLKHGKACFNNIGRELLYLAMGFDGNQLIPISDPFIINKDGSLEYVVYDDSTTRSIEIRRKYYESYNVVEQRRKILGAQIQCANKADFSDALTLYTIDTTAIPDKIHLECETPHRFWRYLAADGTYGSIAELALFDESGNELAGKPIACAQASNETVNRAFDKDWLSNFETEMPDDNWIGIDTNDKVNISFVRVVPRSDDNDVCPDNEYELLSWDGTRWSSHGCQISYSNSLFYNHIPIECLLWLKNKTRGWAERCFLINNYGEIEWW